MERLAKGALDSRAVSGLERWGITFRDIADMILAMPGAHVYIFGGFLRGMYLMHVLLLVCRLALTFVTSTDGLLGVESDDIDILFRAPEGNIVRTLYDTATSRGWPVYLKTDEKSGNPRHDFIAIGDKDAKSKFSGHPIGSGCEGDFACNTLLYDVATGSLLDPSGHGVADSVDFVLRIPYPQVYWDTWLRCDRLLGMKLLRYYNFCSRGYVAASAQMRNWIVAKTKQLFRDEREEVVIATSVFLKRKIWKKNTATAIEKQKVWRASVITEFTKASGATEPAEFTEAKASAAQWFHDNVVPVFKRVERSSVVGIVPAMVGAAETNGW